MPRREDIAKILVIGSGPIVIGQSAEFDYSGTQACKALKAEGYEVVLVNSNPASIMTDPDVADRTYIEPLTVEYLEEILRVEAEMMGVGAAGLSTTPSDWSGSGRADRAGTGLETQIASPPQRAKALAGDPGFGNDNQKPESNHERKSNGSGVFAVLPTVGGQTALNLAVDLADAGVLDKYRIELIGAKLEAIKKAEDRLLFKDAMNKIGLDMPKSMLVNNIRDGLEFAAKLGFPVVIRPSFTLGGSGGGIAYNREELMEILSRGLDLSPVHECLLEESVLGWKEYELEVVRDLNDNVVIICSIENFDPMGVHTGDSITVAPAQTLTDREYQRMRDAAIAVIREIGVETGGSNVQFAVNPQNGRMTVIEMNPRVSRSSALASKATGFPIAKIAARLAVGYTLDELQNDITKATPACFEPTIDYVVVKIPKWQFEKFPGADEILGPQMKSVGEVMAIGRTFKEALMKAVRSLETGKKGSGDTIEPRRLRQRLVTPSPERLAYLRYAFQQGMSVRDVARFTGMDPWFLHQMKVIAEELKEVSGKTLDSIEAHELHSAKRMGLSDELLAAALGPGRSETQIPFGNDNKGKVTTAQVRARRQALGVRPVYKMVDTCAGEFESFTPYLYSCFDEEDEAQPTPKKKVIILGSGPNRIGQGIEFDYCCCHAAFALREDGYETIMVNCNPETVSTDYDTSDRLYFEPLTFEDVLAVYEHEASGGADIGMIVQFGGQTPLNLALPLKAAGVPIIGTSPESIDLAEDRKRFGKLIDELGIPQPPGAMATSVDEALAGARKVEFPVLLRPSYVLGGRAMVIAYDDAAIVRYMSTAIEYSQERPVLIDHFLEDAMEVDVDALCDGKDVVIAGIMQHIEEAGVHSGDSSCVLPAVDLSPEVMDTLRAYTRKLALALNVIGLVNLQFAVQRGVVFVIEVNPRASRTVPYVSKATGVQLAKVASRLMTGRTLRELLPEAVTSGKDLGTGDHFFVKSPVFPWGKFQGVDPVLGPEMRSTGEVMGVATTFGEAFAKAQIAAGSKLPTGGTAFFSVNNHDKRNVAELARRFVNLGFRLVATHGTADVLGDAGLEVERVFAVKEGRPNVVDMIKSERIQLIVNTPQGQESVFDEPAIRRAAVTARVPTLTTMAAAGAAADGIEALQRGEYHVEALQTLHASRRAEAVTA